MPAREQLPALHVTPRFQHPEDPVELATEGLGAARDAPLEPGGFAGDAVGLPRAAQRDFGSRRAVQRVRVHAGLELLHQRLGVVVGGRQIREPAQQGHRGALEGRAAGRERPGQVHGRQPADGSGEVVGGPAHHRALLGEREHAAPRSPALLLEHDRAPAPLGCHHDVAGPQLVEAAGLGGVRSATRVVEAGQQRAVLLDVAVGEARRFARPRELLLGALEVPGERHRVAVGVVLREREVEEPAGLGALVALHEVGGHVVGGPERRRQLVRSSRGQSRDLLERDERVPEHDRVTDVVDAAPARASRELGVLARRQQLVVLAGELRELLDHHAARGHVDAERQRLGREHHLEEAGEECLLHRLLHGRDHARMVRGDAGLQARDPRVVAQGVEVGVVERFEVRVGDAAQRDPVSRVGEPDPAVEALLDGLVTPVAREHEHDGRQHPLVGEAVDHLRAPRLVEPGAARLRAAGGPAAVEASRDGIRPQLPRVVDERRQQVRPFHPAFADHVQVHELDRPALLDDRLGLAAHGLHPRRDLFRVGDRGRQRDDRDAAREVDDHLFPHRAARGVLEIVHLVEHGVAQPVERRGARVDHVAQHLGGHHHDRRVTVDHVVAREQADVVGAVHADEIAVLLVRQCLQGRGVEGLLARVERGRDRVLGHEGLARAGRGRNEHRAAGVEDVEGAPLEVVERKRVLRDEALPQPDASGHGLVVVATLGVVVAVVAGVVVEAAPLVVAVVVEVAPGVVVVALPPVVEVPEAFDVVVAAFPGFVVVVDVVGAGFGATSWRRSPPGHMNPPTTARIVTTPNSIGSTTLRRLRVRRLRNASQVASPATPSATPTSQLERGWRLMSPPVAGMPAGPGRISQTSSAVPSTIPAATATAFTMSARLRRCGIGACRLLRAGLIASSTARRGSHPHRRCTWEQP